MKNEFDTWLRTNTPSGQAWKTRLLSLAAAGAATVLVGFSVVMIAGLGLPAGESALEARAPAAASSPTQSVRYAEPLPTVTVVGRREAREQPAIGVPATALASPATAGSDEAAASIAAAGGHLRQ